MNPLTLTPGAPLSPTAFESSASYNMPDAEQPVTLFDLLRILRVHGFKIVCLGILAAALAMAAVSLVAPVYMGTALVIVDQQRSRIFNDQTDPSVLSSLPSDPTSIETQVQMMQSRALAGQVVDRLNLVHDPVLNDAKPGLAAQLFQWIPRPSISSLVRSLGLGGGYFNPAPGNMSAAPDNVSPAQRLREQTISKLLSGLDVHAVGLSTLIEVDYRSTSAAGAARIANAIAATYIENLSTAKSSASEDASQWLADRVSQLARQAGVADGAVQQYKAENGLVDTSNGTAMTDQQLGDLTTQLIQAQGDEAQAKAKFDRVQQLVQSGHGADASDVVASPLIGQLREQEATLLVQQADLASRYGPLHPAMKDIESRLQELRGKIAEETTRIVDTASNDVAVAAARVSALRSNMSVATSSTAAQNQARVKLSQLEAEATSDHALYQSYLDRLKQTQQQASLRVPDVHLVSPASVPLAPISPKKLLIVGGAAVAGLVLGFLAALVADRMCSGFRAPAELEAALGLPVLATIPELKSRRKAFRDVAMQVLNRPHQQFSEAIRGLEIGLSQHFDRAQEDAKWPINKKAARPAGQSIGKALLVTSALPAEGKTSTSVNLARRLAMSGHRVVLVDADLRRPSIATALDLRGVKYGLADYLAGRCSLDQASYRDPHSSLIAFPAVLDAAGAEATGADVISSPAMAALITRLREVADYVVIDSPPALAVQDARLLARMVDSIVFVVRWGKTPREAAALALGLLRDHRVKLAGAVLARANTRQQYYYSFRYGAVANLADYRKGSAA